jgi:hypothetical protein
MNSQDRNSAGTATVVGNGGLTIGTGGVANSAASSGSEAAATGASVFLRMSVCARMRPSRTQSVRPGNSAGPYSVPSAATTKY